MFVCNETKGSFRFFLTCAYKAVCLLILHLQDLENFLTSSLSRSVNCDLLIFPTFFASRMEFWIPERSFRLNKQTATETFFIWVIRFRVCKTDIHLNSLNVSQPTWHIHDDNKWWHISSDSKILWDVSPYIFLVLTVIALTKLSCALDEMFDKMTCAWKSSQQISKLHCILFLNVSFWCNN